MNSKMFWLCGGLSYKAANYFSRLISLQGRWRAQQTREIFHRNLNESELQPILFGSHRFKLQRKDKASISYQRHHRATGLRSPILVRCGMGGWDFGPFRVPLERTEMAFQCRKCAVFGKRGHGLSGTAGLSQ